MKSLSFGWTMHACDERGLHFLFLLGGEVRMEVVCNALRYIDVYTLSGKVPEGW